MAKPFPPIISPPIIGSESVVRREFADLWKVGQQPSEYIIKLRTEAKPVAQPECRVLFKYRDQLQHQLKQMTQNDILAPGH